MNQITMEMIQTMEPSLTLIEEDRASVDLLIEEALDLVEGYTLEDFRGMDEIPPTVSRVVLRIVIRSLQQGDSEVMFGATSRQDTAGPFNRSIGFEAGTTSGGVWLTKQDKVKLRRWAGGNAGTVRMW